MDGQYIAIDLKSFYASVECRERNLDPITTNLVVADESKTEKTICLAVTPALKVYGLSGRSRLFEVVQKVKEVNAARKRVAPQRKLEGKSYDARELASNPALALDYIIAKPRMALYMGYSTRIYNIYQKYVAPEDIHVYSIDEVFLDVTKYLKAYGMTARQLAAKIIRDVLSQTGITATAGIGTNLYLCKVAMDIGAKHISADKDGVRIAELDEMSYRKQLWNHRPLTDFWRVGRGYSEKLNAHGMYTMGDVARQSVQNEDSLYQLFGINAELLIDHAWGWEPCTIADIKAYKPSSNSIGSGQVLTSPYSFEKGKLVIREMTDVLVLDLVDKGLETNQIVLTVGYDIENLTNP
ncbi:MAG: DNA methylase, partial [Clostridia bacterium]|nr:DNA methylase [Clostridia bacterium]